MRDAVDEAISCGVLEDTMDDDQTCPEQVLLVLMERALRGPTHEGVRTLDWQPQLKRVLQCVRENDPVTIAMREENDSLRAELAELRDKLKVCFPLLDEVGLDEEIHCCEWILQQERKRLHAALAGKEDGE